MNPRFRESHSYGQETIASNALKKRFQISWFDDFHMNYAIMFSQGQATASGFVVTGKYDTGPNTPEWGWKPSSSSSTLITDDVCIEPPSWKEGKGRGKPGTPA